MAVAKIVREGSSLEECLELTAGLHEGLVLVVVPEFARAVSVQPWWNGTVCVHGVDLDGVEACGLFIIVFLFFSEYSSETFPIGVAWKLFVGGDVMSVVEALLMGT